jgi:hypothetical protein
MKDGADPEGHLAQKVSRKMGVPLDMAKQEMGRLVQTGLLKRESVNGRSLWLWS